MVPFLGWHLLIFGGVIFAHVSFQGLDLVDSPSLRAVEKIAVLFRAEKGGVDQLLTCHDHAFVILCLKLTYDVFS